MSNAFLRAYGLRDDNYDDIAIGPLSTATDTFGMSYSTTTNTRTCTMENLEVTGNLSGPNVFTIDLYKKLLEKIESLTNTIESLEERITALEYNPGPGGPKYQETVNHYEKVKNGEITEP